ncbi:MAG: DNA internalization-related competence protein ComEC/Rec2, partial [bacterium]
FLKDRLPCTITGRIYRPRIDFMNKERIYVAVESIRPDVSGNSMPVTGRVIINIYDLETNLAYGARIRVKTKLRSPAGFRNDPTFDYKKYLQRQGIYAVGSVSKKERIERLDREKSERDPFGKIFRLREKAGHLATDTIEKEEAAALFSALILGDRGRIDNETRKAFQHTGTAHLLAVSGLHLGFVLLFWIIFIRSLKRIIPVSWMKGISHIAPYTRTMSLFALFPLFFYTLLTGTRLSTLRAFVMIALYLVAFFFDRLKDYYTTLVWAALIILIWKPLSLFAIDFQFTFTATWGVIFYLQHRPALFTHNPGMRKGMDLLLISLTAVLVTAPLSILYFHYLSPAGILITPVMIPFLSIIIPAGLIATILMPISQWLSRILMLCCGSGMYILIKGLRFLGSLPWLFFPIPSPPLRAIWFFYISLGLLAWGLSGNKSRLVRYIGIFFIVLTSVIILYGSTLYRGMPRAKDIYGTEDIYRYGMEVTFMDVGKGDAALIRLPTGQDIILDGGGTYDRAFDIGEMVLTPYLWSKGVRKIRAVALSHPHPDHLNGLFAILREFPVAEVWVTPQTSKDKRYQEFSELIREKGIPERVLQAGDQIRLGPGLNIYCLHPHESSNIYSPRGENSWVNNHSMVLRIVYDEVSILFTGDIEKEAERHLVKKLRPSDLSSTILKAPHHGSKNSGSSSFLNAVRPEITVISTRKQSWYPMPAPSTMKRLEALPTRIYRTDLEGAVTITTNGKSYQISTWADERQKSLLKRAFNLFGISL